MSNGGRPVFRPWKLVCLFLAFALSTFTFANQASAQRAANGPVPNKPQLGAVGERINSNTIAIISGNPNATYMSIAYDMPEVLDGGDADRVRPIIDKGGGQTRKEVRFLKRAQPRR